MLHRTKQREREEFVARLVAELHGKLSPLGICDLARRVMQLGAAYGWLQETRKKKPRLFKREEEQEAEIEAAIRRTLEPFGVRPLFGRDLDLPTVRLELPSGGSEDGRLIGISVPTS